MPRLSIVKTIDKQRPQNLLEILKFCRRKTTSNVVIVYKMNYEINTPTYF